MNKQLLTKFKCDAVLHAEGSRTPQFSAVRDDENKSFSNYTPWGEIKMLITNTEAFDFFAPGELFLVSFEKVEK